MRGSLFFSILATGLMMDSVFGSNQGTIVYSTKSDSLPSPEIIENIKRKAEEKRLRRMTRRKN